MRKRISYSSKLIVLCLGLLMILMGTFTFAADKEDNSPSAVSEERPVVLTTDAQIQRAKERVMKKQEPYYQSWNLTKNAADLALTKTYVPEQKENHSEYGKLGRSHGQDVRSLALVYLITGDESYFDKARTILTDWAADALANPNHPSAGSPHSAGLALSGVMTIFTDGYALLWRDLEEHDRQLIEAWFRKSLDPIRESREIWETADEICVYGECSWWGAPWLDKQEFNNHLSAQNLALTAIGFALRDEEVIHEAMDSQDNPRNLMTLISGAILMDDEDIYYKDWTITRGAPSVEPGEIYDRYRVSSGNGLSYAHLHLRLLTLQAEIAYNNDYPTNWFEFTGSKGQNLELPFTYYSEFLLTGDPAARSGYYSNSSVDYGMLPLYEIAHKHYPDNDEIRAVLESLNRLEADDTFGWSMLLTHGVEGFEPPGIDSLRALLESYAEAGELRRPLLTQLRNRLSQAERHLNRGNTDQAIKHLDDFLKHLNNPSMQSNLSETAKQALEEEVHVILSTWDPALNWEFNNDGNFEGWRMRKSLLGDVRDGKLHLNITGSDPGMISENLLEIDASQYKTIKIGMRNYTSDTDATLFFITDTDSIYNDAKVVFFTIEPEDTGITEYSVYMGDNPHWIGSVQQLRIDVVHRAKEGKVEVDYIRISE